MTSTGFRRHCPPPSRRTCRAPGADHVVVAMASFSLSDSLLAHYGARIPAMEHRYLNASLLLNRIDCRPRVRLLPRPRPRGARLLPRARAPRRRATGWSAGPHRAPSTTRARARSPRSCSTAPTCSTRSAPRRRAHRRHRAVERHRARGGAWRSRSASRSTAPRPTCGPRRSRAPAASCSTAPASRCRWAARTCTASTTSPRRRSGSGRRARRGRGGASSTTTAAPATATSCVAPARRLRRRHATRTSCWPTSRPCPTGSSTTSRPGGGVVEEMVVGDRLRSPSVQVDLLPGGERARARHPRPGARRRQRAGLPRMPVPRRPRVRRRPRPPRRRGRP